MCTCSRAAVAPSTEVEAMFYSLLFKSTKVMEEKGSFGYNSLHVISCARKCSDLSRQITSLCSSENNAFLTIFFI